MKQALLSILMHLLVLALVGVIAYAFIFYFKVDSKLTQVLIVALVAAIEKAIRAIPFIPIPDYINLKTTDEVA